MIYVTHDQVEAMTMADRIVVLRGGNVEQVGTPLELYNRPANRFVAGFIGSPQMNFLAGRIVTSEADGIRGQARGRRRRWGGALLPVRESADTGGEGDDRHSARTHRRWRYPTTPSLPLSATIERIEQLGAVSFLYCTLPNGERLTVHAPGQARTRAARQSG